ncbi:hypothetical protein U0070_020031 [Myodes glareolus]|uniref:Coronin n=1 Tax=Myodes glareolus TaxID=447135 RepID=A0AAW0HBM4_MYOGA
MTIKLWRLPSAGDTLPSAPGVVLGPEELAVEALQFHPTSDGVLVSTAGRAVKVWDVAKQQPLTELEAHKDLVQSAVWSRDGALVGTACKDKQLRIFDPRARTKASQLRTEKRPRQMVEPRAASLKKLLISSPWVI